MEQTIIKETLIKNACGLDVHQKSIVACVMVQDKDNLVKEIKTFGTMTHNLEQLKEWMQAHSITHVAMESTGVYWKPVFNIIGEDFELILANARHIKNVPGRKTDVRDAEWICQLLRAGLLKGSFIPPQNVRELRNLTRHQKKLQVQVTSEKNRLHKLLQDANIKLSSILSDPFGKAGRAILNDLASGITDSHLLAKHMKNDARLAAKKELAVEALHGKFTQNHQFILKSILEHIHYLATQIEQYDQEIGQIVSQHFQKVHELLQTIPGIKKKGAHIIIAEIGVEMEHFPDEKHLSSWAGLSPGNNQSAGKQRHSRIAQGNKWLKSMLIECAWAAIRKKNHYLNSKYRHLKSRIGHKKALVAIAHKMLIGAYFIIKKQTSYKDLGPERGGGRPKSMLKGYIKKLEALGYKVNAPHAA